MDLRRVVKIKLDRRIEPESKHTGKKKAFKMKIVMSLSSEVESIHLNSKPSSYF